MEREKTMPAISDENIQGMKRRLIVEAGMDKMIMERGLFWGWVLAECSEGFESSLRRTTLFREPAFTGGHFSQVGEESLQVGGQQVRTGMPDLVRNAGKHSVPESFDGV
jgi:hypothetical protein